MSNSRQIEVPSCGKQAGNGTWDHSTHDRFYDYYAHQSVSQVSLNRLRRARDRVLSVMGCGASRVLSVADIGCGAGTQSMLWAELGHQVHALDVNEPLVQLGRERAAAAGFDIDFRVGSATSLPWDGESMDICIALELLEHVVEWQACLAEFTRVLRPGGALYLSTTNRLCPKQLEFNLPLYSWYPASLKHHYERLAVTTRPEIANYARYPAVNWFSFYQFRSLLAESGFRCLDRFDLMDVQAKGTAVRFLLAGIRSVRLLRWFGHVGTSGTTLLAIKTHS